MYRRKYKSAGRKRYRKRYLAKRKWKRTGGTYRLVRRVLDARAETKCFKAQYTVNLLNDRIFTSQPLGPIVRGTGQNERIGESIRLVGYKISYAFEAAAGRFSACTRTRMMIVIGQAWQATSALPATLPANVEDTVFDKVAPRNGAEIWNSDMGKLLANKEVVHPQKVITTGYIDNGQITNNTTATATTTNVGATSLETTDPGVRYQLWYNNKQRLCKWRHNTDQWLFTSAQPNIVLYSYNPGAGYGVAVGTIYMTVHVYYKDM